MLRHALIAFVTLAVSCTNPLFNPLPEPQDPERGDTTPPVVEIAAPSDSDRITGSVDIIINAEDDSGAVALVQIFVDGAPEATLSPTGSSVYIYDLDTTTIADGSTAIAELRVVATDPDANPAEDSITVTVDNEPPRFDPIVATPDPARSGQSVTITFTASEALDGPPTVTVAGNSVTPASAGGLDFTASYSVLGTEAEGNAEIRIEGTDAVGLLGVSTAAVLLDSVGPTGDVTTPNPPSDTHVPSPFDVVTVFADAGTGVASCEVCVSTDGTCDSEWTAATWTADTCTRAGLTCTPPATVTVSMRATDVLGNVGMAPAEQRTCVAGPVPGNVTPGPSPSVSDTHVAGTFEVETLFVATGSPVQSCEVCLSTDGDCNTEWTVAAQSGPLCRTLSALSCTDGEVLTLNMRATDGVSNVSEATPITRICDDLSPVAETVTPTGAATNTHVATGFGVETVFTDAGSGVATCVTCTATDGSCEAGEFVVVAIWDGNDCTTPSVPCSDGDTMTLSMRATDNVGNVAEAVAVSRDCDGLPPVVGVVAPSNQATADHVAGIFDVSATVSDSAGGVAGCDVCVATDGSCDGDWTAASYAVDTCTALAQSCSNGDTVRVNVRATDTVGNSNEGSFVQRVCDTAPLDPTGLNALPPATAAYVPGSFALLGSFHNPEHAPGEICEVCMATDDNCNTEWTTSGVTWTPNPPGVCEVDLVCSDAQSLTLSMRVTDTVGNVAMSSGVNLICDAQPPPAPPLRVARPNRDELLIGWTAPADASGLSTSPYMVHWDTDQPGPPFDGAGPNPPDSPFPRPTEDSTWNNLTSCQEYFLAVSATDGVGQTGGLENEIMVNTRCGPEGTYTVGTSIPAVDAPRAIVPADMNADGIVDLVVTSMLDNELRVYLGGGGSGRGNGTFTVNDTAVLSIWPQEVEVEDFDGDGIPDVAVVVTNPVLPSDPEDITIFLGGGSDGKGNGTLSGGETHSIGDGIQGVLAADFDADGVADLAVVSSSDNDVKILLGDGDGTFAAPVPYPVATNPSGLASGDLNADGVVDLVVGNRDTDHVQVLLGDGSGGRGDGTFTVQAPYPAGSSAVEIVLADFNNDGILDLAASSALSDDELNVHVGLGSNGRGNGTFSLSDTLTITSPDEIAAGEINGDGIPDLVVSMFQSDRVTILTGDGSRGVGTAQFSVLATLSGLDDPTILAYADVNGDGVSDWVIAENNPDQLAVRVGVGVHGRGDGTFPYQRSYPSGLGPEGVVAADVNDDKVTDLVAVNTDSDEVEVFIGAGTDGQGNGLFTRDAAYPAGGAPQALVIDDFNRDAILDLAIASSGDNAVTILFGDGTGGQGDGTFTFDGNYTVGTSPSALAVGDFNRDAILDLAVTNSGSANVSVLLGDGTDGRGDGTFTLDNNYSVGTSPSSLAVADFSKDAILDLAVANRGSGDVTILLGDGSGGRGDGTFTVSGAGPYGVGTSPQALVVGDFDTDAILDIAVANNGSDNVTILLGDGTGGRGDGTFTFDNNYATAMEASALVVGDFDNDEILDLAVANAASANVTILLGDGSNGGGDGTFTAAAPVAAGAGPSGIATGDFDSDGVTDLVVSAYDDDEMVIILGGGVYQ